MTRQAFSQLPGRQSRAFRARRIGGIQQTQMVPSTETILAWAIETYQERICHFTPDRLEAEQTSLEQELQRFPGDPVRLQKLALVKTIQQTPQP